MSHKHFFLFKKVVVQSQTHNHIRSPTQLHLSCSIFSIYFPISELFRMMPHRKICTHFQMCLSRPVLSFFSSFLRLGTRTKKRPEVEKKKKKYTQLRDTSIKHQATQQKNWEGFESRESTNTVATATTAWRRSVWLCDMTICGEPESSSNNIMLCFVVFIYHSPCVARPGASRITTWKYHYYSRGISVCLFVSPRCRLSPATFSAVLSFVRVCFFFCVLCQLS